MQTQLNTVKPQGSILKYTFNFKFRNLYLNNMCMIFMNKRFNKLKGESCKSNNQIDRINMRNIVSDYELVTIWVILKYFYKFNFSTRAYAIMTFDSF